MAATLVAFAILGVENMKKKVMALLVGFILILPFLTPEVASANNTTFESFQSGITLPNRRLREAERDAWIDEYWLMGGPSAFELEVIRLVNVIRREHNLTPLQIDFTLSMAARFYAQTMANLNTYLGHNEGPYRDASSPITETSRGHGASAEIARVFGGNLRWNGGNGGAGRLNNPAAMVQAWMDSPGHRAYILSPEHRFIGAGNHVGGRWGVFHYLFLSENASDPRLYVAPITTPAIVRSATSVMRQSPDSNGGVVRTLTQGQQVTATGVTHDGWMRVVVGNETGWVEASTMREIQRTGIITQRSTLRQSPNNSSGEVRNLSRNAEVQILGTHGSWSQVQRGRSIGWVRTSRVREVTQTAFVEVSRADLRTGPSSSFDRITRINRNEQVTVIGQSGNWLQVQSGRRTGWVSAADVRVSTMHAVTRSSTALREGASSSTTRMRTLANNTPVLILAESGSWTHIQQGSRTGWVRTSDVRASRNDGTTRRNAALRSRPRSSATRVITVNNGTRTRAIAQHGNWSLVQVGSRTGWMRTSDIR